MKCCKKKEMRWTYSVDVLWSGCVGSIGPVALKGKVVFGTEQEQRTPLTMCLGREILGKSLEKVQLDRRVQSRHSRVWRVDIVDGHTSLDASQCKASRFVLFVLKYGNTAVLHDRKKRIHKSIGASNDINLWSFARPPWQKAAAREESPDVWEVSLFCEIQRAGSLADTQWVLFLLWPPLPSGTPVKNEQKQKEISQQLSSVRALQ